MRTPKSPAQRLATAAAALCAAGPLHAQVTFQTVADTNTSIPGKNQPFASFRAAAIEGGIVVFLGAGFPSPEGIYRAQGNQLTTVADSDTVIPGVPPPGTLFPSDPSLSAGNVAFTGAFNQISYIVTDIGGLSVAVQPGDPIAGFPGAAVLDFFTCSLDNGSLGFAAFAAGGGLPPSVGIYSTLGGLHPVATVLTTVPGTASLFDNFCFNPTLSSGGAAFCGGGGTTSGVYRGDTGVLQLVADTATTIPGTSSTFTGFSDSPTIRGTQVAFRGSGPSGLRGVYADLGGGLVRIADTTTSIPGGTGTFTGFSEFSQHGPALNGANVGPRVAFRGQGSGGQEGIYAWRAGALGKVVAIGDTVNSKVVSGLDFGREGFDRRWIAFTASFTDGSSAVLVASLP